LDLPDLIIQLKITSNQGLFSPAIIGLTLAVIGVLLLASPERSEGETIAGQEK